MKTWKEVNYVHTMAAATYFLKFAPLLGQSFLIRSQRKFRLNPDSSLAFILYTLFSVYYRYMRGQYEFRLHLLRNDAVKI